MALDIRDLDSTRFRSLQSSAAELHQRLKSIKKDKTSLDEDDDDDLAYKVLGSCHHSIPAPSNWNAQLLIACDSNGR